MGDVCPTEDYRAAFDIGEANVFGDVLPLIINSDLAVCNLECPATNESKPILKTGPNLKAEPKDLALIKNAGFDAVSLANNHILDFGAKGVLETLDTALKNELVAFGAGENIEKAKKPAIFEIKGWKIGFISFAESEFNIATESKPGACVFDPYTSLDIVRQTALICDYLIVLYHGGIEHYKYPSPMLQIKCRAIADAGANLIICQHSHCIGTKEKYKNAEIIYGQGNAVFGYQRSNKAWNEGLVIYTQLDENRVLTHYRLICAGQDGIMLAQKEIEEKRLAEFENESAKITDMAWLYTKWEQFCEQKKAHYLPQLYGYGRVINKLNRILNNGIMQNFLSRKKAMLTHNLIRCESHREVVETILKNIYEKSC